MKELIFNEKVLLFNDGNCDIGSRIGTFLFLLAGDNRLDKILSFTDGTPEYKEILESRSDDNLHLRGACGPRVRWWVGADQYAEAERLNTEVEDVRDLIKPKGIDQFRQVCDDLHRYGMNISTIVVRDPALDFEETSDIPDLLTCTFEKKNGVLNLTLVYEEFRLESYLNDLWAWNKMLQIAACFMKIKVGDMKVVSLGENALDKLSLQINRENSNSKFVGIQDSKNEDFITDNVVVFWDDVTNILNIVDHIRCMLREEVLIQPDVSVEAELSMIYRARDERLKTKYIKSLLNAFLIWVITYRLQNYGENAENHIIDLFEELEYSFKYEVADFLFKNGMSLSLQDKIEGMI